MADYQTISVMTFVTVKTYQDISQSSPDVDVREATCGKRNPLGRKGGGGEGGSKEEEEKEEARRKQGR